MISALTCLTAAIFFEARDQPIDGQMMVAEVVLNRVASERYPDTVCEVVYQKKQFSFTHDGKSDKPKDYTEPKDKEARRVARKIAQEALQRPSIGTEATHYHNTEVSPPWASQLILEGKVGDHIFYTEEEEK